MTRLVTLLAIAFVSLASWSTPQVYFHYKVYYTPDHQPFISTSLQFSAGTFKYNPNGNGHLVSQVEITQLFKLNDSIAVGDHYVLNSPEMRDSLVEDFYDVQHYAISPGIYTYEIIIRDLISGEEVSGEQVIRVDPFQEDTIMFSDIELIQDAYQISEKSNFVKHGFFILPYLTNYFPPEIEKIAFYTEIYNTDKVFGSGEKFLLTYSISDYDSGRKIESIFRFKRLETAPVTPVIDYLPIVSLPSGNYDLEFNVINKDNDTVMTDVLFFQRRNDEVDQSLLSLDHVQIDNSFMASVDQDSISFFLNSIMPICPRYEYETIRKMLKTKDTTNMSKYFYAFWVETDPKNPTRAWNDYKKQVYYAEKMFGTQIKHGFETDRGRIHLKYGSPNSYIDRPNEPSAYPYQIWHYYRIGQRSNVKFVFYNPDMITNDYPLLHTDLQGEIHNYKWQQILHSRDTPNMNIDQPTVIDHYGGNSGLLYTNP